MATPVSSVGKAPTDMEDPWNWDVDQVVDALCYRRSPLLAADDFAKAFPEPDQLEYVLRENSVGGLALLTDVNNATMREDLGIKQFGHRSSITHLIRLLRRHSPKWLIHHQAVTADNYLSGHGGASNAPNEIGASSFARSPSTRAYGHTPYGSLAHIAAFGPNLRTQSWVQGQSGQVAETSPSRSLLLQSPNNVLQEAPTLPHPRKSSDALPTGFGEEINTGFVSGKENEMERLLDKGDEITNVEATKGPGPSDENDALVKQLPERQGETFIIDENGRKRRKLVLGSTNFDEAAKIDTKPAEEAVAAMPTPPREDSRSERLLSTSSTAEADQFSHAINNNDEPLVSEFDVGIKAEQRDPVTEPGVVIRTEEGRKRVRPILISQPIEVSAVEAEKDRTETGPHQGIQIVAGPATPRGPQTLNAESTKSRNGRLAKDAYLGIKACPVDEIFYGSTALGETLNQDIPSAALVPLTSKISHPENFAVTSERHVGNGHHQYVNNQIKYFLSSGKQMISTRGGSSCYAVVPYSDKLVRKHQPLSMTQFRQSSQGYIASRQNRAKLAPNNHKSVPAIDRDENVFDLPELTNDPGNVDAQDPDFLEKWKYMAGEDSVLPVFGDSGSEGEYDLETWQEMEEEQGTLKRAPAPTRNKSIGHEEVNVAIDKAIEQIKDDWKSKRMPKLQAKGWRLWRRCTRDGSKQHQINELDNAVTNLEARLNSLRKEISREAWSSSKNVIKQCNILQPSVYDSEDSKWLLAALRSKRPPERPQNMSHRPKPRIAKVKEIALMDGEEAIASDDSATNSSEADLDGFVVDDDDVIDDVPYDDIKMADVEDEGSLVPSEIIDGAHVEQLDETPPAEVFSRRAKESTCELATRRDSKSSMTMPPKASINADIVCIDLTQTSDPVEPPEPDLKLEPVTPNQIRTPPLKAQPDSSDESGPKLPKSATFKRPPVATEIIELESDTEDEKQLPLSQTRFPDLRDYDKICQMSGQLLEERQDRKRLLIWTVAKYSDIKRQSILDLTRKMSHQDAQLLVWKALNTYKGHSWRIRGQDTTTSDSLMLLAAFYVCWTIPVRLISNGGIRVDHLETTMADEDGFHPFYHFLIECLSHFETVSGFDTASQASENPMPLSQRVIALQASSETSTPTKVRKKEVSEDYDPDIYATPHKKRKFVVQESQEAKALQTNARLQAQGFEQRKKMLAARYQRMGLNDEDPSKVVVNPGKEEGQEFIYLNPKIGQRIQPHQRDGVQFMWRALITNPEKLQGCLLAHTMGLGKTMQVITILVTIAEAAKSSNVNVCGQIPESLRMSQTLVICPPSLVENWFEEFLMWAPDPVENNVGRIQKVTAAHELHERVQDIKEWGRNGGVLLMGFNTFRNLVGNVGNRLTEKDHEAVLHTLLEKPNLIVADEAHTAKNLQSKLNMAMNRFTSTSRIGLTGSPLANNLDEYYALIDWIAPSYLGDHVHFKARYAEPIALGFYKDSSPADYVQSRLKLKALIADLEPIVHRADITVLRGKLRGKTEFLIKVPLTQLQMDLYREYVDWMLGVTRRDEPHSTLLWSWLGELRLLCNHPKCYKEQLEKKLAARNGKTEVLSAGKKSKKKTKARKGSSGDSDIASSGDEAEMLNGGAAGPQVSQTMLERQLALIEQLPGPIDSVTLAYKMQVLDQILLLAKEANDRTLIFSHSLKALDYLQQRLERRGDQFLRIDGKVLTSSRQAMTKDFNTGSAKVCLISTRAGGQGLNLFGANRVVILDTHFNPIWEEQAIGRAYRLGQQKPVYVYRLTVGGTWEEALLNQSVFKQQLATRVVDKKNPMRYATKGAKQYLFQPKELEQKDLQTFIGKDPLVLDRLLDMYRDEQIIRSIDLTETFLEEDTVELTEDELKAAQAMHEDAQLRRRDPIAYQANIVARQRQQEVEYRQKYPHAYPQPLSHPYDQVQPPSYPDKFRHFVPASGYGSPSSITPGGHAYPMVPNQYNRPVPSSNPANMDAAPLEPGETYTAPTLQTSNVVPVLGANTTRWDRSRSPEKQSAEIIHAPEAGSEPHADGMDVETNGPALNDPIAPVEQSRASEDATVEFPAPDNSTNTPSAEIGTVPTTANNASIPNPPLTEGPATPSPAPTLKRKLSPSATDSGRKQHKSRPGFGFPALNNLFRRESSRNGDNQTT